jgi:hypothetical protein
MAGMIHAAATPSHACNFVMPLHTEAQQKILQKKWSDWKICGRLH